MHAGSDSARLTQNAVYGPFCATGVWLVIGFVGNTQLGTSSSILPARSIT
jgi:hypothetical protein